MAGWVYLNCCSTLWISVWQSWHWKDPVHKLKLSLFIFLFNFYRLLIIYKLKLLHEYKIIKTKLILTWNCFWPYWPLWTIVDRCCPFLTVLDFKKKLFLSVLDRIDRCWPLLTIFDHFWPFLSVFDHIDHFWLNITHVVEGQVLPVWGIFFTKIL